MKVKFILIFAIIIFVITFFIISNTVLAPNNNELDTGVITINNKIIAIEVAQSENQQILGLGNRDFLAADTSMLFPYDNYGVRRFWMKGMNFPLDIIWINDNIIVGIESDVPAPDNKQSNLPVYTSPDNVNFVLEVNAGFCDQNNIEIGDVVDLNI